MNRVALRLLSVAPILLLALAAGCRQEQALKSDVSLRASADTLRIGESVRLDLSVRHPADSAPQVEADFPPLIEIRSRDRKTVRLSGAWAETRWSYELTSFEIGAHTVFTGRVTVGAIGDPARLDVALTGLTLRVKSVLEEQGKDPLVADWLGYPEPVAVRGRRIPVWIWALPLAAALALAVGLLARRHGRPALEPDAPPPPHETALAELKRLRESGMAERGEREPYYVALSAIVRNYLEARFHLRAPEQTTEEFLRETAESVQLSEAHRKLTAGFLEQSDLVKFARWEPEIRDMRDAFEAAERLVRETISGKAGTS